MLQDNLFIILAVCKWTTAVLAYRVLLWIRFSNITSLMATGQYTHLPQTQPFQHQEDFILQHWVNVKQGKSCTGLTDMFVCVVPNSDLIFVYGGSVTGKVHKMTLRFWQPYLHTLVLDASDAVADYSYVLNTTSFIWTPVSIANTNLGAGSRFGHSGRQINSELEEAWPWFIYLYIYQLFCIMTDPCLSFLVLTTLAF